MINVKFILLFLLTTVSYSQVSNLISFELKDQFDRVYTDKDYQESIFMVIGSNARGSKYNPIWSLAIYNELKDESVNNQLNSVGLANLSSVPFFLKAMIRNKFPKDKKKWILMDWKGKFSKAYNFKSGMSNILIFDHEGQLVYQTAAKELDSKKLSIITKKIIELKR